MKDFWEILACHCVVLGFLGGFVAGTGSAVAPVSIPGCIIGVVLTVVGAAGAFLCIEKIKDGK